jgi:hypothetical protein
MSWYTDLVSKDVGEAARALAGNWRRFEAFAWSAKPADRPDDCAIVYLSHRDSDTVDESNHAMIVRALRPAIGWLNDGEMVETCRHGHYAVGHVDGIVLRCVDETGEPTWAFRKLYELAERLDVYPILDETDHSEREQIAADQTWQSCYSDAERVAYIRAHRRDFQFHSLADLAACVRGKFFAGCASDFLSA